MDRHTFQLLGIFVMEFGPPVLLRKRPRRFYQTFSALLPVKLLNLYLALNFVPNQYVLKPMSILKGFSASYTLSFIKLTAVEVY